MLDSIYHMTNTLKSHFWRKNVIILPLCTQRCYGRHNVSRKSKTTSGLQILLHSVISLPCATSYDKYIYKACNFCLFVLLLYVPSQQPWSLQDGQFT